MTLAEVGRQATQGEPMDHMAVRCRREVEFSFLLDGGTGVALGAIMLASFHQLVVHWHLPERNVEEREYEQKALPGKGPFPCKAPSSILYVHSKLKRLKISGVISDPTKMAS